MAIKVNSVLGIPVHALSMDETIELIKERIDAKTTTQHVVLNAAKIVAMKHDKLLSQSVIDADIINADGMSVVWASRVLGSPLPERVAGIDLMTELIKVSYQKDYKCYFLGASQEVLDEVVNVIINKYSPDIIAGSNNGYFKDSEEAELVERIAKSGSQILFVGMSSPKKELFINKYKHTLNVPFVMGVGGSFDVIAGKTQRAPVWMQKHGLEWFYRFIQEPDRMWKRYLIGNSKFILLVLKEKLYSFFK